MNSLESHNRLNDLWRNLQNSYRIDEPTAVNRLISSLSYGGEDKDLINRLARDLILNVRQQKPKNLSIENFLQSHHLNTQEGLVLMSLAEALLRIPDTSTKTQFIREKISEGKWTNKEQDNFFNRLANLGLATSGKILNLGYGSSKTLAVIGSLIRRFGEPLIRQIIAQAMKIMSEQFIMGETITTALKRAQVYEKKGYRYSYDMLGEGARTQETAKHYLTLYEEAISDLKKLSNQSQNLYEKPGISIKLSALHPRYEWAQHDRIFTELTPVIVSLCQQAKKAGVTVTIDAEESERLELSLQIFQYVFVHEDLKGWEGLGIAVQAYQKHASTVIDWLIELAQTEEKRLSIRLVKGAYWDSEIKRTQEQGLNDYAVYTQKPYTDLSYFHCAEKILQSHEWIYPQFATHNAYTVAFIYYLTQRYSVTNFEFQRLQGMGETLYQFITENPHYKIPCRIYAPVGPYRELLAYLVRRLLENGANSSFVNQIYNSRYSVEQLTADPLIKTKELEGLPHPKIPLPKNLYGQERPNSRGIDFSNQIITKDLEDYVQNSPFPSFTEVNLNDQQIKRLLTNSAQYFVRWKKTSVEQRSESLENLAKLLDQNTNFLISLLVKEAHKTLKDAVPEIREAIDFCYYYAQQARHYQKEPFSLSGPTGELNQLSYQGKGVFVCISPWNFPLAIFLGQIAAALVTGNTVIAKPSHLTPRIAAFTVNLAYQAGIPKDALQIIHMSGSQLGQTILNDPLISGVTFTGSTETAHTINQILATKSGPIVPFIAETGGINAMIVDSSALWEQVIDDVLISAFQSAGQRCSCLRLLLIQDDVADGILEMLKGAMAELRLGDPALISTDIGPVIDTSAYDHLTEYLQHLEGSSDKAKLLYRCHVPEPLKEKNYIPPQIWELSSIQDLTQEVFGPILHVVRYRRDRLDSVMEEINAKEYGLTLGIHTRLETTVHHIVNQAQVGNIYVNRSMIGAVVGVQPFGGHKLSGTGPKAGGPNYLLRFMNEVVLSYNTTANGGNASLLMST